VTGLTRLDRDTEYATERGRMNVHLNLHEAHFRLKRRFVRLCEGCRCRARDGCTFIWVCRGRTCIRSCICTAYQAPY